MSSNFDDRPNQPWKDLDPSAAVERATHTMERFLQSGDVSRAFGEPAIHGERLLLPAAEVFTAAGFGAGYGAGGPEDEAGAGGGGGGGGHTFARPVALIEAGPDGVTVHPVVDLTKIALAALTAGTFVLGTWWKLRRAALTASPERPLPSEED